MACETNHNAPPTSGMPTLAHLGRRKERSSSSEFNIPQRVSTPECDFCRNVGAIGKFFRYSTNTLIFLSHTVYDSERWDICKEYVGDSTQVCAPGIGLGLAPRD